MQRAAIAAIGVAVAAIVAVAAWTSRREPAPAPSAPGAAPRAGSAWRTVIGAPPVEAAPVTFVLAGCADDHFYVEPCSKMGGGGLLSLAALFRKVGDEAATAVPIYLGDLTHVGGELGRAFAAYHYGDPMNECGPKLVAAGPADLAHGSDFCRRFLSNQRYAAICANAADAVGSPVLKGWTLLDSEQGAVLVVATVDPTTQDEVTAAGSDLRILPAADAVADAIRQAGEAAKKVDRRIGVTVLLHHGTPAQTADVVRQVPGVTFAVATRGGDLPSPEPTDVGGTPVFASARRLTFAWAITTDGGSVRRWSLIRVGAALLSLGSPIEPSLVENAVMTRDAAFPQIASPGDDRRPLHPGGRFAGAQTCVACHTEQVNAHSDSVHAKRPAKFNPISLGRPQCMQCHMTGGLFRTGWHGKDDSSDLGAVSCEACHGPGAAHAETPGTPYGRDAIRACRTCHTPDRSPEFDAEAIWKRWGHGARR